MSDLAPPSHPHGAALVAELWQLIDSAPTCCCGGPGGVDPDILAGGIPDQQGSVGDQRAGYGEQVIAQLAADLTCAYGRGWSKRNLANMCLFAQCYPDFQIVQTLSAQLSWSHFVLLLGQRDDLPRHFYAELACIEGWSVRQLQDRVQSMLFDRSQISDVLSDINVEVCPGGSRDLDAARTPQELRTGNAVLR